MKNKVELLVPAGGEKQFIAAVENGADAIYVGGNFFNARINAENFDREKMQAAIDYAHQRGVKVNVTMNTLVTDDELADALEYAAFLYEAGADALIIQDLGLGAVIRKALPDFELHLSTQAGICDIESLEVCRDLGYQRVVLARELSLEDIKSLCGSKICDIEVFVHGAMCICYSGQCQLSRYYGGRSGNRGRCAQPCRLPYRSYKLVGGKGGRDGHDAAGRGGSYETADAANGHDAARRGDSYELIKGAAPYPLSPKDMCQIDNLGELISAGVCSFKIEGRMKSPEYVSVVTRIYRKYIDEFLDRGRYTVSREDREALLQIFNRGDFTEGYMFGNPGQNLMSERIPKNQGICAGEVVSYNRNTKLVNVRTFKDIAMHDSIEIRSSEGKALSGSLVGSRKSSGKAVSSGLVTLRKELGNSVLQLGDFGGRIGKGDLVYRISSCAQLEEARASFEGKSLLGDSDRNPIRKLGVDMKLMCLGDSLTLCVQADGISAGTSIRLSISAGPFEISEDRNTPYERYRASLSKMGNTPFELRSLSFEGDYKVVAKASEINAMRRQALAELAERLCIRRSKPDTYAAELEALRSIGEPGKIEELSESVGGKIDCPDVISPGLCERARTLGEVRRMAEAKAKANSKASPGKGAEANSKASPGKGAEAKAEAVIAGFELNAYNSKTVEVLRSLGADKIMTSLEALDYERKDIAFPLMISKHVWAADRFISDKGHDLTVIRDEEGKACKLVATEKYQADSKGR